MTKQKLYKYIGYNGTITSPVLLPDISHLELVELRADGDKYLTDGEHKVYSIIVPANDVNKWTEEVRGITE
jgi:hypothetical protein